jgi:hypothetical protein
LSALPPAPEARFGAGVGDGLSALPPAPEARFGRGVGDGLSAPPPAEARFGSGVADGSSAPPPAEARFGGGVGDGLSASPRLRHLEPVGPGSEAAPGTTRSGLSRRIRGAHGAGDVTPSLLRASEEPVSADIDVLDFFAGYQRGEGEDR